MIRVSEIQIPIECTKSVEIDAALRDAVVVKIQSHLHNQKNNRINIVKGISRIDVFKRSFDARGKNVMQVYIVDVYFDFSGLMLDEMGTRNPIDALEFVDAFVQAHVPHTSKTPNTSYFIQHTTLPVAALRPVVVGFGPCGIFAALVLAQMGLRPIVLERGKSVQERTKDTWGLWRKSQLDTESNVQFGEGGAGTFSDGKLYSQIKDPRHLGRKVMHEFVKAGAPVDILTASHPHIGTFKLVKVVENLRKQIIDLGGEIRFEHRLVDVLFDADKTTPTKKLQAITVLDTKNQTTYELQTHQAVLALGHSARDTFEWLHERGVFMQAKPFSIGFRIEHPQSIIDKARWGRHAGNPILGAADYKLVHHAQNQRSVYSFCMCPGGTVVAATSEACRVVTNGMSQYSRNERNANAGVVVGISPSDFIDAKGNASTHPLAGMHFQRRLESQAYILGGENYHAPAQLVGDFLTQRASTQVGRVIPSYKPGVRWTDLDATLPKYATDALREAIPIFGKKIQGFDMHDAVLTGVETRTSSPIQMARNGNFQSINSTGIYPAGEGASYAGGILSAGVDGIKVAEAVAHAILAQA